MKILHTSDWHIGHTLCGRKRYEEFEAFLTWLDETIQRNKIDTLLVAGDVFDTSVPSNRAQQLYYRFLCRVASSSCRHIVVVAGNHDSPTFLNAPKELLKALDIHIIGSVSETPEDEVLVLCDGQNRPELIVCAVPYLRDKDLRLAEAGESIEDKEQKLLAGIRSHYAAVAAIAEKKKAESGAELPVVAMGHLYTAGGQTVDGDGVRELYIGSLARVSAEIFPECFNYLALGHLHSPQKVSGAETRRYSGSPLHLGFGEAKQQKSVCRIEFHNSAASVQLIAVPVFQQLERVKGDWNYIAKRIFELSADSAAMWIEVIYEGDEIIGDLRERLEAAIAGTHIEILRVRNNRIIIVSGTSEDGKTLDDMSADEVFKCCLVAHKVPEEQHPALFRAYSDTLLSLDEDDRQAE
jgi:exonuclease SbcD